MIRKDLQVATDNKRHLSRTLVNLIMEATSLKLRKIIATDPAADFSGRTHIIRSSLEAKRWMIA